MVQNNIKCFFLSIFFNVFQLFFIQLSASEITLSCGEDRLLFEARKRGYLFDGFVDYTIDQEGVKAEFNSSRGVRFFKIFFINFVILIIFIILGPYSDYANLCITLQYLIIF